MKFRRVAMAMAALVAVSGWAGPLQAEGEAAGEGSAKAAAATAKKEDKASAESEEARPFSVGERLAFDVSLLGIRAAEVNLNVSEAGEGYRFVARGHTVGPTDSLFSSRQSATCSVDETLTPTLCRFSSQSRSGIRRRELRFDHETGKVRERTLHQGKTTEQEVLFDAGLQDVQDALSGLYLLRTKLPDAPGEVVTFRSMRKGKAINVEATFDRVETVETEFGTFSAAKVDVRILEEQESGATTAASIWFTLDERKMPVKLSAAAPIGTLVAELRTAAGLRQGL